MKSKRGNHLYHLLNKKNNNSLGTIGSTLKQLQNLHRSIDRLPSNDQAKPVLLKTKKPILNDRHASESKNKRKATTHKKTHNQLKKIIDDISTLPFKRKEHLITNKSTSTLANFKKSPVVEQFELKIELQKSGIKKLNSLCNSSSSRYLRSKYHLKQQKNHPKRTVQKNSYKIQSPVQNKLKSPNKISQTQSNSTQRYKYLKDRDKIKNKSQNKQQLREYIFLDGKYIQVDNPITELLTNSMVLFSKQSKSNNNSHQFVNTISLFKTSAEYQRKFHQQTNQSQSDEDPSNHIFVRNVNNNFILANVIFIQRWWRQRLKYNKLSKYTNKIYTTPKASPSSQHSLPPPPTISPPSIHPLTKHDPNQQPTQITLKNLIEVKQELISRQHSSQKHLLTKMFELNKIDHITLSNSLAKIDSHYQKQILSIYKLKQQIEQETIKTKQLQNRLQFKYDIISDIENIPTHVILDNFFQKSNNNSFTKLEEDQDKLASKYQRQKSTGCHYSSLSEVKLEEPAKQDSEISSPVNIHLKQFEDEDNLEQEHLALRNPGEPGEGEFFSYLVFYDQEIAQAEIDKRYAVQLGMGYTFGKQKPGSILTSVISIHNFLTNFLKFYQYFYRDEFLKLINLPYGLPQLIRLKKLQGNYSTDKQKQTPQDSDLCVELEYLISNEILEAYQEHTFQLPETIDESAKAAVGFEKIHQRALVDCFNQALNCFRPYFYINGAPYSWNYSEKALTFYFIAQENIHEVFQKTQYKVLKSASCLCGTIVEPLITLPTITSQMNLEMLLDKYRESINPILAEGRDEKLCRVEKLDINQGNYLWENFEEDRTFLLLNIGNIILEQLVIQLINIKPIGNLLEQILETVSINYQKPLPQTSESTPQRKQPEQTIQSTQISEQQLEQPLSAPTEQDSTSNEFIPHSNQTSEQL